MWYACPVDEGRKRVLLIAASILVARKLAQYDSGARACDALRSRRFDPVGRANHGGN